MKVEFEPGQGFWIRVFEFGRQQARDTCQLYVAGEEGSVTVNLTREQARELRNRLNAVLNE